MDKSIVIVLFLRYWRVILLNQLLQAKCPNRYLTRFLSKIKINIITILHWAPAVPGHSGQISPPPPGVNLLCHGLRYNGPVTTWWTGDEETARKCILRYHNTADPLVTALPVVLFDVTCLTTINIKQNAKKCENRWRCKLSVFLSVCYQ